jgi:hypothetical protein
MNRDSELSLKVIKDNFDAKSWSKEIQEIKVALKMKEVELAIAPFNNAEILNVFFNNLTNTATLQ